MKFLLSALLLASFCFSEKVIIPEWEVILDELNVAEGLALSGEKLYVTEVFGNKLLEYDLTTQKSRVIDAQTGRTNGLVFDEEGNLWGAAMTDKCLYRWNAPDFTTRDSFPTGVVMNDLVIDKGILYFTDPDAKKVHSFPLEGSEIGSFKEFISLSFTPNGIAHHREHLIIADFFGKTVYAVNRQTGEPQIKPLVHVPILKKSKRGLLDGMEVVDGSIYLSTTEGVKIVNLESKECTWLQSPKNWKRASYARVNKEQTLLVACFVDKVALLHLDGKK